VPANSEDVVQAWWVLQNAENQQTLIIFTTGMTKTYRLTYEAAEVMHALFDKTAAAQGWRISARVMREYVEYFGPKTEQLDLCATEGKVIFTSFTEKIQDGKQVLKQPLETVITLHTEDFDDFHMQENVHITIRVKDFKAIVMHAETLHTPITAYFSYPTRPLQFSYQNEGMACSFTLMTIGDFRGASSTPNPNFVSTRSASRQPSVAPVTMQSRNTSEMPPPALPAARQRPGKTLSSQSQRKPLRPQGHQPLLPEPEPDDDSLFMPAGDDERTWDPPNFDQDEEEEEMLGWDAANDMRGSEPHPTFRDSGRAAPPPKQGQQQNPDQSQWEDGLAPTQRLSQVRPLVIRSTMRSRTLTAIPVAWHVRLMNQSPHVLPLCSFLQVSAVKMKLVAHPPNMSITLPGTSILFHLLLTSHFSSVCSPQFPCSPQPQAKT
jgi:cell cycle checkpoint control protein RAD9A